MAVSEESWGEDDVVRHYATSGFLDPGERAALAEVGDLARGRVLDLGVGGGRTTGLLRPAAASYVGIDLAPGMLALARSRFPDADLRVGDATDLDGLPDAGYDLVTFSCNGIDSVGHDRRLDAMRSMARVLAPGGRVVFSSLNRDGVSFDERPWTLHGFPRPRALRQLVGTVGHPLRWARGVQSYRRTSARSEDGEDWATRPLREHEYRFLVHFATPAATTRMLAEAGLRAESAYTETGARLPDPTSATTADYVHFVCGAATSPG